MSPFHSKLFDGQKKMCLLPLNVVLALFTIVLFICLNSLPWWPFRSELC